MNALLVDQRYLGHRVTGVDEEGRQFTGPLQKVSQQTVADRIVFTIGNTELKVPYSQVIVITIARSMPQDPRQRDADRAAAEFIKTAERRRPCSLGQG